MNVAKVKLPNKDGSFSHYVTLENVTSVKIEGGALIFQIGENWNNLVGFAPGFWMSFEQEWQDVH